MPTHNTTAVLALFLVAAFCLATAPATLAHCQVPCGIYDDDARVKAMKEDTATITKAIKNINALAGKTDATSINQLTRWINTKEAHASTIITTIAEYFLTQKIKPVAEGTDGYPEYLTTLAKHHAVMVAAMKSKQQPTPAAAKALAQSIDAIAPYWVKPQEPASTHSHSH